nr:hypothetical protein [Methanophagales archaeon]
MRERKMMDRNSVNSRRGAHSNTGCTYRRIFNRCWLAKENESHIKS